jgi:hypothetical protein
MFGIKNLVAPASWMVVMAAFEFVDDELNGTLAYAGDSFGYRPTQSKLGCADYRLG